MAKSTQELAGAKAGQTAETNGFGGQETVLRPGGLYRLKDDQGNVVDEQIVITHPLFGDSQASAFERVGYKYVRPARDGEVKQIAVAPANIGRDTPNEDLKGIQARLSQLEADNKAKEAELAQFRADRDAGVADGDEKQNAKAEAKLEAASRVQARTEDGEGTVDETARTEELKNSALEDVKEDDATQDESADSKTKKKDGK